MSDLFSLRECQEILDNYTNYRYLEPLIEKIELKGLDQLKTYLEVTWIEKVSEQVFVDEEGWYVASSDKYPTFEALAMKRSKGYNAKWGDVLTQRLKELDHVEST